MTKSLENLGFIRIFILKIGDVIINDLLLKEAAMKSNTPLSMFSMAIFKEMILYITERCGDKETYAYTHLNKILYYSDLFWYGEYGTSLSGETYAKDKYGARATHMMTAENELRKEGYLKIKPVVFFKKSQKKPILLKSPSYKNLTKKQQMHIDQFINKLGGLTAMEVTDYAHKDISYSILKMKKPIPYESVFFLKPTKEEDLTEDDLKWAESAIQEYEK